MMQPKIVDPDVRREAKGARILTDVAVGVLIRASDHAFLLTSRPDGKPYGGYWEFPGGKLEAGESALDALIRELSEEIGIQVQDAVPWKTELFDYPHAMVRLQFFKVNRWDGEIEMRENQKFQWSQLPVTVLPVLPGTVPVLEWLAAERGLATSAIADAAQ